MTSVEIIAQLGVVIAEMRVQIAQQAEVIERQRMELDAKSDLPLDVTVEEP